MTPIPTDTPADAPDEALVTLSGVGVRLGERDVLTGIDLAIRPGEIVTVVGPNGAGKSTLLRVVLGMLAPRRGRVARRPGLSIGYVPQSIAIDRTLPLTVRRFLCLPRRHPETAMRAALAEVGVEGLIGRELHTLSGGEFQRVLLARALMRRPDLLVLDEPAQGVDAGGQIRLYQLIARLRREHGFAVLMVSHDLHLVMRATDEVLCLNTHVCCQGKPEAVSRPPAYTDLFGPEAARTLAVYRHAHDHAHDLHGDIVPAPGAAQGGGGGA